MTGFTVAPFDGRDLALEMLDAESVELMRLFRHPKGEWEPPDPVYRNLRVDPPVGHKDRYAVLYTADTLGAIGVECRILAIDSDDGFSLHLDREAAYQVARYRFDQAACFIPIDGANRRTLGLDRAEAWDGYGPYQQIGMALFERYGHFAHGLSWASFHRNQPGRVFAIWHERKTGFGLALSASVAPLAGDAQWIGVPTG
jgi:hypothetical protein